MDAELASYNVKCHCGNVSATIKCSSKRLDVWECNCSDCIMRGNVHFVIPAENLTIDEEEWKKQTTLYLWGTKTAQRRFCSTCGILPFYTPRSNPDGYGITVECVDFADRKPEIELHKYDGVNWEQTYATSAIKRESKA